MLFMLHILCDVIQDVIDNKHVYVWRIWLTGQSDSFGDDWLQLLHRRVNILINVLGTVIGNEMNCFMRRPVVYLHKLVMFWS